MTDRYLEDLSVGETRTLGAHTVERDEIVSFAEQFTPHPYHTDEAAAEASPFGELTASGWHTLILTARIVVTTFADEVATAALLGVDDLRWREPVRVDDRLAVDHEIAEVDPERGPDGTGLVRQQIVASNQDEATVLSMEIQYLVSAASGDPDRG